MVPSALRITPWGLGVAFGLAPLLGVPTCLSAAWAQEDLYVANPDDTPITLYATVASGSAAPLRMLEGPAPLLRLPASLSLAPNLPTATVHLDESGFLRFFTGDTITYLATLTPGPDPTLVDTYLGTLAPDGVTFISLVEAPSGEISIVGGPSPIPFQANATISQTVVPFSYTVAKYEPVGKYAPYATLAIAGSNPLLPEDQLSAAVRSFQSSSDVILSVDIYGVGVVTSGPGGIHCAPTFVATFAPGTTVTLTAQSFIFGQPGGSFDGGDFASVGRQDSHRRGTWTHVMTTSKTVSASFECPLFLCGLLRPSRDTCPSE